MCSVNHDLKAIYMHIPKVGGNTVKNILEKFYGFKTMYFINPNHSDFSIHDNEKIILGTGFTNMSKYGMLRYYMSSEKYNKTMNMDDEKWKTYYKFSFIRNPYDKIISAWKFCKQQKMLDKNISLYDFLTNRNIHSSYVFSHAYLQQTDHLLNLNNELDIDFAGRFEYLYEDLNQVLFNLGITEIKHTNFIQENIIYNKSNIDSNYTDYFDISTILLTNELFSDDFNNFNFKKCNNIIELKNNSSLYYFNDEEKKEKNKKLINKMFKNNYKYYIIFTCLILLIILMPLIIYYLCKSTTKFSSSFLSLK